MLPPRLPVNVGHYEDSFRQIAGHWLLARRVTFLPFGGSTERLPWCLAGPTTLGVRSWRPRWPAAMR
jgi:hypothetical protein